MKAQPHLIRRALAAGLDYFLYFGILWAYVANYGEPTGEGYQAQGCGHVVLMLVAWLVLIPLPEGLLGFTLGKGLFGLQVVDLKGRKVSLPRALFRHCFDLVDFAFGGLVAAILILTTQNHQRIGDLVAYTKVVSDKENKELKTLPDVFA